MSNSQKTSLATWIAAVMHLAGIIGMQAGLKDQFLLLTPFNLVMMFILVWLTAPRNKRVLVIFFMLSSSLGFLAELVGVHTGLLFGNYQYGTGLGPKFQGVPLLIGINWFLVVYGSGMLALYLRQLAERLFPVAGKAAFSRWFGFSLVLDGALLATLFDWLMEPGATRLGFWTWSGNYVPMLNYLTWFVLSLVLLFVFRRLKMQPHPFVVNLLLIQALFFLLVRS